MISQVHRLRDADLSIHTHTNGSNNIFSNYTVHEAVNWDHNSLMLRFTGTANYLTLSYPGGGEIRPPPVFPPPS